MKKISYILASLLVLFMSSCDDLGVKITDRFAEDKVWNDEKLIVAALANLYDGLELEHNSSYFEMWDVHNVSLTTTCDEGSGAYQAGPLGTSDIVTAYFDAEWFGKWKATYEKVYACNMFIKKLEESSLDENLKPAYLAEARFLRAFQYFTLVKRYGGVPLITAPQEYNSIADLAVLQVPRDKEQVIWQFIVDELSASVADLPAKRLPLYRSRITRYGAYALQSRAALYAGSIAKYGTLQLDGNICGVVATEADKFFAIAATAADSVINSGKYALYEKYADKSENYRNLFIEKGNNGEYIFWKEFSVPDKAHSWDLLNVPFSFVQNGYGCGQTPTLDLIQAYENIDGTRGTLNIKDNAGNLIKYDSPLDLFKDKDPRLKGSFYLPYDACRGKIVEIRRGIYDESKAGALRFVSSTNPKATYGIGASMMTILGKDGVWDTGDVGKTGFYTKKFSDETVTTIAYNQSSAPWPVFRLAEIYLNKSEAAFELNKSDEALNALNMVRARAGIRSLNVGELTMDRIRNERRVELAYENHRHWDLKRWRTATTVMANFETDALYPWYVWADGKFVFTTAKAPKPNKVFLERNYYVRITDADMGSNPRLGQNNPGY